jgi:FixJ family two-component response regulator
LFPETKPSYDHDEAAGFNRSFGENSCDLYAAPGRREVAIPMPTRPGFGSAKPSPGGLFKPSSIAIFNVRRRRRKNWVRAMYRRRADPYTYAFVLEGFAVIERSTRKQTSAVPEAPIVLVIDDDPEVRDALGSLFRSVGLEPRLFGSTAEFLQHKLPEAPCCVVLDIRLPGVGGLDFQAQLTKANNLIPIVMITGHGDIPMSVQAMKAGAVDFLTKPFRHQDMLDAVAQAIERDRKRRDSEKSLADLKGLFGSLTTREREIMTLVTAGLMNKQVAAELGLSEITVKIHRGHLMRKMGLRSLADLVRAAEALELRRSTA